MRILYITSASLRHAVKVNMPLPKKNALADRSTAKKPLTLSRKVRLNARCDGQAANRLAREGRLPLIIFQKQKGLRSAAAATTTWRVATAATATAPGWWIT
jgi:hypothetical protein